MYERGTCASENAPTLQPELVMGLGSGLGSVAMKVALAQDENISVRADNARVREFTEQAWLHAREARR